MKDTMPYQQVSKMHVRGASVPTRRMRTTGEELALFRERRTSPARAVVLTNITPGFISPSLMLMTKMDSEIIESREEAREEEPEDEEGAGAETVEAEEAEEAEEEANTEEKQENRG